MHRNEQYNLRPGRESVGRMCTALHDVLRGFCSSVATVVPWRTISENHKANSKKKNERPEDTRGFLGRNSLSLGLVGRCSLVGCASRRSYMCAAVLVLLCRSYSTLANGGFDSQDATRKQFLELLTKCRPIPSHSDKKWTHTHTEMQAAECGVIYGVFVFCNIPFLVAVATCSVVLAYERSLPGMGSFLTNTFLMRKNAPDAKGVASACTLHALF